MTAQYTFSPGPGGRHFVNQDFMDGVETLFPLGALKIPLGWRVRTSPQGKDEVLFIQHTPLEGMEGQIFEVSWPPPSEAFTRDILPLVEHTKVTVKMARQRLSWTLKTAQDLPESIYMNPHWTSRAKKKFEDWLQAKPYLEGFKESLGLFIIELARNEIMSLHPKEALEELCHYWGYEGRKKELPKWIVPLQRAWGTNCQKYFQAGIEDREDAYKFASAWGETLGETQIRTAARAPTGLYGYTKAVQASCESCVRRLNKQAASLVKRASLKDPQVLDFLMTHSKRAKSLSAKVLLASYKESLPKIASTKEAGVRHYGMYGFPVKTASTGLALCTALREAAGVLGSTLHQKRAAEYKNITGFLGTHGKTSKCGAAKLLLSVYPDETVAFGKQGSAKEAAHPETVDEWLLWEPEP